MADQPLPFKSNPNFKIATILEICMCLLGFLRSFKFCMPLWKEHLCALKRCTSMPWGFGWETAGKVSLHLADGEPELRTERSPERSERRAPGCSQPPVLRSTCKRLTRREASPWTDSVVPAGGVGGVLPERHVAMSADLGWSSPEEIGKAV